MTRAVAVFAIVVVSIAGLAGAAVGAPAADAAAADATTQANATAAPGARLAGVVDVQEAEVGGELATRAFGHRLARANSNASRAALVAGEFDDVRERLATLHERHERLQRARENGTISRARYRAETAGIVAHSRILERRLNRTNAVAVSLPADELAERGVDAPAIEFLRQNARNLSGPEVVAIAHSIAGPTVGGELSDRNERDWGIPGYDGPPGREDHDDGEDQGSPNATERPLPGPIDHDTPTLPGGENVTDGDTERGGHDER